MKTDYLGDPLPEGYKRWSCDICTASCNFEAMQMCCGDDSICGFNKDKPESNFGIFAFIIKDSNGQAQRKS